MAEMTQWWQPDTCDYPRCVIPLALDDDLPDRVVTYRTPAQAEQIYRGRLTTRPGSTNLQTQPTARLCTAHAALGFTQAMYDAVRNECTRKNDIVDLARSIRGIDPGDQVNMALLIAAYNWSFLPGPVPRVIQISFGAELTALQRVQLQTDCNTRFGVGMVVVRPILD